jgi:hypothetical protein
MVSHLEHHNTASASLECVVTKAYYISSSFTYDKINRVVNPQASSVSKTFILVSIRHVILKSYGPFNPPTCLHMI